MKKQITKYVLLALVCLLSELGLGQTMYNVVWENLSKATFSLPTLQRASGASGTGKATSENMLFGNNPSNRAMRNNGYMTYTSNSTNQSKKIGFSVTASENTEITHVIDYGFTFQTNGKVKAFTPDESSSLVNYSTSDEFWLERRDEEMIFRMGATELLRVRIDPTETLMLRAELTSNNSTFSGVKVSFDTKRFVIDPIIDNTANTMKMQITGGQSPFLYNWEDGQVLNFPDAHVPEKAFAKGPHELLIRDDNNLEFHRTFLLGNSITWANFSNTSQSGTTLNKTTSTGWGSAISTAVIGDEDYFWVQYMVDLQAVDKAFGVAYTGTSFSQYTHLQAGFLILGQNQLQVIYQGNIVLTTEYNDRDALMLANDAKGLQWLVNGKAIYQQAPTFTNDLKVGGLLKDNASLNKVTVFNINHKPLLSSWSATDLSGSVTVNIASLTNGNSPYHYYISETPIPQLHDIYTYTRDTIFSDTTGVPDSLQFFQGSHLPTTTTYTFDVLESSEYYVSVFDKEGLLLYGNKINVAPPLVIYNTSGITLNTSLLTSTGNNAKTDLNYLISDEIPESSIYFTVKDASEKYSMGLSDFSATTTAIQYGFFVNAKTVKFYVNGTLEAAKYSVKNNNILSLEKVGTTLYYKINDVVFRQVTLTGTYLLTTQFDIAKGGTTIGVATKGPNGNKTKVISTISQADCDDYENHTASFVVNFNNTSGLAYTFTIRNILENTDVSSYASGTPSTGNTISLGSIPMGVYLISGHLTLFPFIQFSQAIAIGIESQFQPVVNYTATPNTYSLKKTVTAPVWSSALTLNIIRESETQGWVSLIPFAPNISQTRNYISFNSDYSMAVPYTFNGTFVMITRLQNTSQGPDFENGGYNYRFYSNGSYVERFYATKRRVTAFIDGSVIKFYIDGILSDVTLPRPAGDLHIKFVSRQLNESFRDVVSTFRCITQSLNMIGYRKVTRELDESFSYAVQGQVKFILDEEYEIDANKSIPMKLYSDKNVFLASVSFDGAVTGNLIAKPYSFEDNRYTLDISDVIGVAINKYYYIEFTNSKNQKRYFKFYYKN
ncbi:MAG: hypothetical protein K0R65_2745 [Crocinitomicaceae bacterium]|jgi:hypothetical protein|nr:hypothetical protein [Crocinitomicaceae bacterium]